MFLRSIAAATLVALTASAAIAAEPEMMLLPNNDAAHWAKAPPDLPHNMQITILTGDPSKPGPFVLRVKVPANTVIAPHTHSADENLTVLSGSFYHGMGNTVDRAQGIIVETGGYVFLPANMPHSLWTTTDAAVIQVTGMGPFGLNYVNPADDPSHGPD